MTSTPDPLTSALTALLVSGIAGAFSFLGLVITKEQKISEYRQEWINALRDDLAFLISRMSMLLVHIERTTTQELDQLFNDTRDDYVKVNEAALRIKLRLNPDEEINKTILTRMRIIEQEMNKDLIDIQSSAGHIRGALCDIESTAPELLKSEWKRVKRGEMTYLVSKWLAGIFLLVVGYLMAEHIYGISTQRMFFHFR